MYASHPGKLKWRHRSLPPTISEHQVNVVSGISFCCVSVNAPAWILRPRLDVCRGTRFMRAYLYILCILAPMGLVHEPDVLTREFSYY
ncbi:hypothetical protein B0J17DRAFT_656112 [Rhizoctonia solani]|nr:hypothetical protein B0J17DRAFT_656112 [Rhizoctonia solani]